MLTHWPLWDVVIILKVLFPNICYGWTSHEDFLWNGVQVMPQGTFDDKSTLVQASCITALYIIAKNICNQIQVVSIMNYCIFAVYISRHFSRYKIWMLFSNIVWPSFRNDFIDWRVITFGRWRLRHWGRKLIKVDTTVSIRRPFLGRIRRGINISILNNMGKLISFKMHTATCYSDIYSFTLITAC